jgi:hypothetical protein
MMNNRFLRHVKDNLILNKLLRKSVHFIGTSDILLTKYP